MAKKNFMSGTGAKVGIGVAALAGLGGIGYLLYKQSHDTGAAGDLGAWKLDVSHTANGEVTILPGGPYVKGANTKVTLTAAPAQGNHFEGWSGSLVGVTNPAVITMDSDKTIVATFYSDTTPPAAEWKLNLQQTVGGTIEADKSGPFYKGAGIVVNLKATALATGGYKFTGWTGGVKEPYSAVTSIVMDSDKTVSAVWAAVTYTLTPVASPAERGHVHVMSLLDTTVFPAGSTVELQAVATSGSRFVSWAGAGITPSESDPTYCWVYMDMSKTVTANFAADVVVDPTIKFTLTVQPVSNSGGLIQVVGGLQPSYASGTPVYVSASAFDGYVFSNWVGTIPDEGAYSPNGYILMNGNKTIGAVFSPW